MNEPQPPSPRIAQPGRLAAPAQPARPRRAGAGRWLAVGCVVIMLVVVLFPATVYLWGVISCRKFAPTGDELFDTYARAVINRQAPQWFLTGNDSPGPWRLPDATLAAWEPKFGNDPRYWELRYYCTALPFTAASRKDEVGFLEEAQQRGVIGAGGMRELWIERHRKWQEELESQLKAADPQFKSNRYNTVKLDKELLDRHGTEIWTFLDAWIAAAPDESYPHYMRARWLLTAESYAEALAELQAGNAAPVNRLPICFPTSVVVEQAAHGQPAGNEVLAGVLLDRMVSDGSENYVAWKGIGKALLATPELADDPEWRQAYLQFACRFGSMQDAPATQALVGAVMVMVQAKYWLIEHPERLTKEQREAVYSLSGQAKNIANRLTRWSERQRVLDEQSGMAVQDEAHPRRLDQLMQALSFTTLGFSQYWYRYQSLDYRYMLEDAKPGFKRLAKFDFRTFSWPPKE